MEVRRWSRRAYSSAGLQASHLLFANSVYVHIQLTLISLFAFFATKQVAFADRGGGDYRASHDLEDLITVIDGRAHIVAEARSIKGVMS